MAKGSHGKSSATSGTRKKHAKKAAGPTGDDSHPPPPKEKRATKKERGQKKKEPRVKVYIPPVKPAPVQPDPLETTGLVHKLPPELLVVLRSFNKKSSTTKVKALEDLQVQWMDKARREGEDGVTVYVLIDMLPVWLHHLPGLLTHPSRRVRSLASGVHNSLTQLPQTREHLLTHLSELASPSQLEFVLGTWSLTTHDVDRSTAVISSRSWNSFVSYQPQPDRLLLNEGPYNSLVSFLQRAILDPNGIYQYLNPAQPPPLPPPTGKKGVRKVQEPEPPARLKAEDIEEEEQDRNARLRIEALASMKDMIDVLQGEPTVEIMELIKNPALWTSLYYGEHSPATPDMEAFGFGQPNVRKAAWGLVGAVQEKLKDRFDLVLPILAPAILRSAWVEPDTNVHGVMLPQLLKFLKAHPHAWEVERTHKYEDSDEDDDGSDEDDDQQPEEKTHEQPTSGSSKAYEEFLHFLGSGCAGSAIQGYPAVIIILSTIPSSVFSGSSSTPLSTLFTSFWKALDSRALSGLQRTTTSGKFLEAVLECLVFLVRRVYRQLAPSDNGGTPKEDTPKGAVTDVAPKTTLIGGVSEDAEGAVRELVVEQVDKVWETVVDNGSLKVEPDLAGSAVAGMLVGLSGFNIDVYAAAWETLSGKIERAVNDKPDIILGLLRTIEREFSAAAANQSQSQPGQQHHLEDATPLLAKIRIKAASDFKQHVETTASQDVESLKKESGEVLVQLITQFRQDLFADVAFREIIDPLFAQHAVLIMNRTPDLFMAYLRFRNEVAPTQAAWRNLLSTISENLGLAEGSFATLLQALDKGDLPQHLTPGQGEVDALILRLVVEVINGDEGKKYEALVQGVLGHADQFISEAGYAEIARTVTTSLSSRVQAALTTDSDGLLDGLNQSMLIFVNMFNHPPKLLPAADFTTAMPDVFSYSYLLPEVYGEATETGLVNEGRKILMGWTVKKSSETKDPVQVAVIASLGEMLVDTTSRIVPQSIFRLFSEEAVKMPIDIVSDLFPSLEKFDQLLNDLPDEPLHPSLAVIFPLIPPHSEPRSVKGQAFDSRGFSTYARVVEGLLQLFVEQRRLAKQNVWALRHFHALKLYAQDLISVSSDNSSAFKPDIAPPVLEALISKVDQITAYILNSETNESWHDSALSMVLNQQAPAQALVPLAALLVVTINVARQSDKPRDVRVLRNLLQHVFQDISKEDADSWIMLARKLESPAPYTSMAIVSAISEYAPEPPRLDRYRNELAASLLGIRPAKANTEGLTTLLKLAYSAPDPESDIVFLPQPRAVNVMKACQQWISSDEDIDEELESAMTLIAFHLAPLLQDVPGAHWDLIFDLIENNLEAASLTDDDSLVALARTLRLITMVQNLASTNKSLRADWEPRKNAALKMIKDLATVPLAGLQRSQPRSTCRELILSIILELPPSLIDHEILPKMSHLITDPSMEVQKVAYQFLRRAAKKTTEHAVIEAGVDTEAEVSAKLAVEIIDILQREIDVAEASSESVFSYLLGWMLLFDLFEDASLKVRTSYIDQLRSLDLFVLRFIPAIIHLLSLDQGPLKSFKLNIWSVDEYYVDHFDPALDFSIPVFGAHLYYRALLTVPSLISSWVLELKDRQLSSSISTYTAQNFSPVLVRAELDNVRAPESMAQFVDPSDPDKSLKVRVASNVNEVSAAYAVDDHQLEIRLKIPTDWPLHRIEVKDAKKIGVDENRWRAWLLAIQQIIWSHNGRIVDGLTHFKNNVTGHFEGQVECAICYSIISVMDGTLPKKPCRTCKNRFHAGCLYKWFNTSHSSSCPLCRSDIF